MPHTKLKNTVTGGMDLDSDSRFVNEDSWRYALNIRAGVAYIGKQNVATNVKGNSLVSFSLPDGDNKCIGSYEDKQNNKVLYFIYNSNNQHGIYQYEPSVGGLGAVSFLIAIPYTTWTADTKITSIDLINGKLLYWNDPVPRKINIQKANLNGKKKEWTFTVPAEFTRLQNYTLEWIKNGVVNYTISFPANTGTTRAEIYEYLVTVINGDGNAPIVAEGCDCYITIREKTAGSTDYQLCLQDGVATYAYLIPFNWYGQELTERMFERGKWQPPKQPNPTYKVDSTKNFNYVKEKVFQFRLGYIYDDFEYSALGGISEIAINNVLVNQIDAFNYVELLLEDFFLTDSPDTTLLRGVDVLVREHNEGAWRKIETIEYCDYITDDRTAVYKFYNNIATTAVDDATQSKQYDDVPLECGAGLVVKNRGILAHVRKGYDAPECVDLTLTQSFEDTATEVLYNVSGKIRIWQNSLDGNSDEIKRTVKPAIQEARSGIFSKTDLNDYPIYGGVIKQATGAKITEKATYFDIVEYETDETPIEAANTREQLLPEGGFTVYSAGTDYFTISQQIVRQEVIQSENNIISLDSVAARTRAQFFFTEIDNDIYSSFNLRLPKGVHIIRIASPWCSYGDKLVKGSMYDLTNGRYYQSTSAPIWGVDKYDEGTATYTWNPKTCEIRVEVTDHDIIVGEFWVKDNVQTIYNNIIETGHLLPTFEFTNVITGYLLDNNGQTSQEAIRAGLTMEKSYVLQKNKLGDYPVLMADWTDHNGYYSVNGDLGRNVSSKQIFGQTVRGDGDILYYSFKGEKGALELLQTQTLVPSDNDSKWCEAITPSVSASIRTLCSSFVEGTVLNQDGEPVNGALVIYENGRYEFTDSSGNFKIVLFGDMRNLTYSNQRTVDEVVVNLFGSATVSYPMGQLFVVDINPFYPDYTPTAGVDLGDIELEISLAKIGKARKRGGNYLVGVRYYDDLGRFCSVVQTNQVYVPFITEDLNQYFPVQYPVAGTYKYGKPTISWSIAGTAPLWAKYFRIMWSKNLFQAKLLQWVVNEVKYITSYDSTDDTFKETTFANSDATSIMLNISNLVTFGDQNQNSQLSYSFTAGDRVRLIAARDGVYHNGLFDYEVTGYKTGGWLVIPNDFSLQEIQSGEYIEIYNAATQTEDKSFYETGETFEILDGGIYKTTSGTFTTGDTYWYERNIPVNDDTNNFSGQYSLVVESNMISDFYSSEDSDIGRVGAIDLAFKQITYPTMMQHSNIYVEGSAINGLSSFDTVNFKELNVSFGAINRLFYVGNTLLSVHENKVVSNYIELRSLSDSNTTDGLLAISDAYFGNDRPFASEYGCQHPESAYQFNNFVYFLDAQRGIIGRVDNNGLDAISDKKVMSFVRDFCAGGIKTAFSVFDPYYREYIVSLEQNDGNTATIAWSEVKNVWTTFYSYRGENYCSINRSIVSFKDGALWLHDVNPIHNNFYGVQYTSKLTLIPHSDDYKLVFYTLTLQSGGASPLVNNWFVPNITNSDGQVSRLTKAQFRMKESFWCASFLRDETDTSKVNPIVNGRNLRGQELVITLENDATNQIYLQQIITDVAPSLRE